MIAHLNRGLLILGERWWSGPWITEGKTALDQWVRRGLRALFTAGMFALLCTSWWLLTGGLLVVAVKALRAATKAALAEQQADKPAPAPTPTTDEPDDSPEEDAPHDVSAADLTALAHQLLDGAPGVHLATLAGALGGGHTTATVRALCTAHGIPVRPSVRDASRRVSPGLHRADLPPLPAPLPGPVMGPDVAVVAAGQPPTTTPATPPTTPAPTTPTTPTVTIHGGVRVTAVADPDNPARTHVRVLDTTKRGAR